MDTIKSLIKTHKMIPHPEGGHYVEVYKNKDVSHIYYLLEKGQYSHWHRIKKNETIHFYTGSPLRIYTSKNGEEYEINEIGSKNRFIYSVESNTWFSLESTGLFSLIGCTVAPAFEFEDLEIAPKKWKPSKFRGYLWKIKYWQVSVSNFLTYLHTKLIKLSVIQFLIITLKSSKSKSKI